MDQFDIIDIDQSHATELARLHRRCFEGYFLTELGIPFLQPYYAEFCRHDYDYGVVARSRQSGELVAFVVGTADTQAHFRSFYRRNMAVLLPLVVWRVMSNGAVRKRILGRMAHIKAALRSSIPGMKRPASETISDKGPKDQCPVRLLSIAAAPECRGSGVAAQVATRFEELLRQAGHKRVGLSVLSDNARAIAFYKKSGWEVTHSSDAGWWFERDL